ncbi:MAG: PmoA family protein [Candidatus Hydrogenedentes bacterium]|nr:PmoA family protein [Candidatus Hydrogenedentota bacterium]
MKTFCRGGTVVLLVGCMLAALPVESAYAEGHPAVSFKAEAGRVAISVGDQVVAAYVYQDKAIPRPYFCQVKTPQGLAVTRPHPPDPVANKGNDDHAEFHPGIWLAFGDLGGEDFWRNKAKVRHVRFLKSPAGGPGHGEFSVENEYVGKKGNVVCRETCTYSVYAGEPTAWLLVSRSEFRSDADDFTFGDQEEMGLGVRLNTPLTVEFGSGKIVNSEGGQNEEATWGKPARWCAAWGNIEGRPAAISVMPAPGNFRPCWFHTRNYGLIVANPFGVKAMTAPEDPAVPPAATTVKKGDVFTLTFGIWISDGQTGVAPAFDSAYEKYLKLLAQPQ